MQVTLGQSSGDEPPLAEMAGGGSAAPQPAPAPAPAAGGSDGGNVVPGFEPTDEQMAQFRQVTGAVESVSRGKA